MTDQILEIQERREVELSPLSVALNKLTDLRQQVEAIPDETDYQRAVATIVNVETKLAEHSQAAGEFFEMLTEQREAIFMELSELQTAVADPLNTNHPQVVSLIVEVADAISAEVAGDGIQRGQELERTAIEDALIDNLQYHVKATWTEAQSLIRSLIYDWEKGLTDSQADMAMEWIGAMRR